MKSWFLKGIMAAAIALPGLSDAAWAGGSDDFGCSNATLKGEYAFGVTSYQQQNYPPLVVAGVKFFDGQRSLTQRDYTGDNLAGDDFAPPGQEKGTYQVNPDCTGSMVINLNAPVPTGSTGGINILFVISDGGRHIHEVVSEFTPPGASGPIATQTSGDDWKVASAQNN